MRTLKRTSAQVNVLNDMHTSTHLKSATVIQCQWLLLHFIVVFFLYVRIEKKIQQQQVQHTQSFNNSAPRVALSIKHKRTDTSENYFIQISVSLFALFCFYFILLKRELKQKKRYNTLIEFKFIWNAFNLM